VAAAAGAAAVAEHAADYTFKPREVPPPAHWFDAAAPSVAQDDTVSAAQVYKPATTNAAQKKSTWVHMTL
jgi:hypothetical protein